MHYISGETPSKPFNAPARIGYKAPGQEAGITPLDGQLPPEAFSHPPPAITPDRSPGFYGGTAGHVDFTYEVSRSLGAWEGALLVIDATQGIEAQTLANLYLALEADLTIIPIINKIDLPSAEPERVKQEVEDVIGLPQEESILASAKEGIGTQNILEAIVHRVPPPKGNLHQPLRALVFDSHYDSYKGVIAYVRIVDGELREGERIAMIATGSTTEILEAGYFQPRLISSSTLSAGEVGYIATGF